MKPWNRFEDINITNFSKIMLKFAIVLRIFEYFLSFPEFHDHYWSTKFFGSCWWDTWENFRDKNGFEHLFKVKYENFLKFSSFSFILYDLIIMKARKLEVAESNLIMENIPGCRSLSLSLLIWFFLLFLFHILSLSYSISLSLSLSLSLTLLLMPHFSCYYVA